MFFQIDTSSVILGVKEGLSESTYLFVAIIILLGFFLLMRSLGKKKRRDVNYRMDLRKKMNQRK